jgi:TP901 family phage tail tape measure protein
VATTAETLAFEVRLKDFMTKELKRLGASTQRQTSLMRRAFDRVKTSLARTNQTVKRLGLVMKVAFAASVFMGIRSAVVTLREFSRAMSEVRTILDETTLSFDFAKQKVVDLTYTTTASGKEIAKGLYQTLSAGVTDGADAMTMLTGASKLSVGALMTVNEAVDLLTNTFNAYGMTVSEEAVTATADLMFQTVKLGKTTGPELAHSLGMVMPVASNLGVSIEELNAMLAALTLGGMDTAMASTQLRQAMVQLLNPSDDAKKLMKEYNVEISAARVSQEGFLPVLADLKDKFGDNAIAMRTLFPNIRALVGVMALAGNQFDSVNRIMRDFSGASGSVEQAVEKMRNSLDHKMKLLSSNFSSFWLGMTKTMKGAVEDMSTDQLERQAKASKKAGEELGKAFRPITTSFATLIGVVLISGNRILKFFNELGIEVEGVALKAMRSMQALGEWALVPETTMKRLGDQIEATESRIDGMRKQNDRLDKSMTTLIGTTGEAYLAFADLNGIMVDPNLREMINNQNNLNETAEANAQFTRDRAEAQRMLNEALKNAPDEGQQTIDFARLLMADRAADQAKKAKENRRKAFEEEIGNLMTLTDFEIAQRQRAHDHEIALNKDLKKIKAEDLDSFRAMKEEESRLVLQARQLELDTAFLAMLAEEEFQKLTEKGQQNRIREFKTRMEQQMQAAKAGEEFANKEAVEQEAYLMRLEKINRKEQELVQSRMDLADSWEEFGMTSDNAIASGIQGLKEWASTIGTVDQNIQQLTATAVDGFITAFLDGIEGAIDGTKTFREAFQDFGRMFLRMMAQMIMQQIVLNSLRSMFPTMGFATGGVVPGGTGSLYPLADGGVVSGGLGRATPVKAYANGGPIVDSPHVALIGEGKHNEAVVPLPDGRSIPVDLQGSSSGASVNISISAVDAAGVDDLLIQRQSTLRNIIRQAMEEDRAFRQAVRQR